MKGIKKLKQIFAMALAMIMMFAMAVPAMADETAVDQTYSITITNAVGTYEAYQVFSGDLVIDSESQKQILSNVAWGSGVTPFTYEGKTEAKDIADLLSGKGEAEAKAFADAAAGKVTTASGTAEANGGKAVISGLEPGYYVILNTLGDDDGDKSISRYILQITADQEVKNKADVPSFEKKLKDTNDTTGAVTDWQDSADYDIGDEIPFKLEGTVAANYDEYKGAYKFIFHDQEEAGLTFLPDSVKVYVDNKEITSGYEVKTSGLEDGYTFEVVFDNLRTISSVNAGSKIRVEYNSRLNESAVLGQEGNVNKAKLEFSNDPNSEQGGTGETPWDNVIVFTYKIVVNKYANEVADGNKLAGAEFTLEKKLPGDKRETIAVVKSDDGTSFTFSGLDDGNYILTETVTPSGYNTIDPIEFEVTAEHKITWTNEERTDVLESLKGDKVTGEIEFTAIENNSGLSTNIVNKSGATLPSTGGIGTRIFYLVGGVLMAGAAILLVAKKRMSREN